MHHSTSKYREPPPEGRTSIPLMTAGVSNGTDGLKAKSSSLLTYTLAEVGNHRTPDDAWMIYRNKVYNVSGWDEHPGGHVIFTHAGDDFTDIFTAFHPNSAYETLDRFLIGTLDSDCAAEKLPKQVAFENAYRELRGKLLVMGMFKANHWYYAKVGAVRIVLGVLSIACAVMSDRLDVNMLGALLMALFWQQCGWLAHDYLHHQVFKNRVHGDLAGLFWGTLMNGYSSRWLKSKHNIHHSVPNLHASGEGAHDGDPDMDTMPVLAWSVQMAKSARGSTSGRFMIAHQAVLYFPVLLVARISWIIQSVFFVFDDLPGADIWAAKGADSDRKASKKSLAGKLEMPALIGHYMWVGAVLLQMPFLRRVSFFLLAQTLCGLLQAWIVGLGHNGMASYDAQTRPDFWNLQVTTTRNVTDGWFVDFLCGGLQYQMDHHLFPQVPRHNLKELHGMVESFCNLHGVGYHETTLAAGTWEVLTHLGAVSAEFVEQFPGA